ncbi:MAG: fibrillarin-like rRNA/tRNA 2'-O-methyltransferase [Thermoplasmata archaeon]|nr:fibrillarin-like rRNA/tRNA 2'-O-methyltransferase [Thermoplasmata archaeon]
MEKTAWEGVFRQGRDLYTRNANPGHRVYGEDLKTESGVEYRLWDPFRSKLAAYFLKSAAPSWLRGVRTVLYLGGSHGTTASHVSELLPSASIFVVEKSPVSFAPLLALSKSRANILPILADAQLPERYAADVGAADLLYQDVAQRAQAEIFHENARSCLAPGGVGVLMLKVRSVTQSRSARSILAESRSYLERNGWKVLESIDLAPFSREHTALVLRND